MFEFYNCMVIVKRIFSWFLCTSCFWKCCLKLISRVGLTNQGSLVKMMKKVDEIKSFSLKSKENYSCNEHFIFISICWVLIPSPAKLELFHCTVAPSLENIEKLKKMWKFYHFSWNHVYKYEQQKNGFAWNFKKQFTL